MFKSGVGVADSIPEKLPPSNHFWVSRFHSVPIALNGSRMSKAGLGLTLILTHLYRLF